MNDLQIILIWVGHLFSAEIMVDPVHRWVITTGQVIPGVNMIVNHASNCDNSRTWVYCLKQAKRNQQPGITSKFSVLKITFSQYLCSLVSPFPNNFFKPRTWNFFLLKEMTLDTITFCCRSWGRIPTMWGQWSLVLALDLKWKPQTSGCQPLLHMAITWKLETIWYLSLQVN